MKKKGGIFGRRNFLHPAGHPAVFANELLLFGFQNPYISPARLGRFLTFAACFLFLFGMEFQSAEKQKSSQLK